MMRPQGFWKTDDMYRAVTRQIEVTVEPNFLPERSVEGGQYFWSYTIVITNTGEETVQLRTRHWRITDSRGMVNLVEGEGVVGETPELAPGQTFDYVSGCELMTNRGSMEGNYTFARGDGSPFEVSIPFFPLAAPARTDG